MDKKFKKQFFKTVVALITAAFGMVAALAWNEAIKAIFAEFMDTSDVWYGMVIYAVLVTIIVVLITLLIANMAEKAGLDDE